MSGDSGATWTSVSAVVANLSPLACSADGTRLVASAQGGGIYVSTNSGAAWVDVSEPQVLGLASGAPTANWRVISCSADGTNLVAIEAPIAFPDSAQIYTSGDRGANWTLTSAPFAYWTALASSADGSRLAAVAGAVGGRVEGYEPSPTYYLGPIFCSADFGATWTQTGAPLRPWSSVACSTNGESLLAATFDGAVFLSNDSGATWTPASVASNMWFAVAMSADGTRMAAAPLQGLIYVSTNAGAAWMGAGPTNPLAIDSAWLGLAMSADGLKLAAVACRDAGGIFTSGDGGGTWTQAGSPNYLLSVACSADGATVVASGQAGLYLSKDSGATWTEAAFTNIALCVALSADGSKLAAGTSSPFVEGNDNGQIFIAQTVPFAPAPRLSIATGYIGVETTNGVTSSNGCINLSWQVALTGYTLQENSSLDPAGWVNVTSSTEGVLSLDINHDADNQAVLSELGSQRFFRLKKE